MKAVDDTSRMPLGKTNHGGRRPGAGRKWQNKVRVTLTIRKDVLEEVKGDGVNLSELVEVLLEDFIKSLGV